MVSDIARLPARPWRSLPGVRVEDGRLMLPAGSTPLLDLGATSGWRYELRWEADGGSAARPVRWQFGGARAPEATAQAAPGWHRYRLQADLAGRRGYLSRDGQRVADFPLEHAAGQPGLCSVVSEAPAAPARRFVILERRPRGRP